ncbi:MAG TPA: hypothetical protein PLN21_22440 [Gemmatales bacterium]|nr:hypothetical protein [Gemmatales bacterium]
MYFKLCIVGMMLLCPFGYNELQSDRKPKIINMERLNTAADEDDPCPAVDGLQFLFCRNDGKQRQLYLASRKTTAEPMADAVLVDELTGEGECRSGFLLPKNKEGWEYFYFATQYHTDKKQPNFDIYRVGRFNPQRPFQGYSAASPVQMIASEADEAFPWVSADAKELYFSRKIKSGWQLMRATATDAHVFDKVQMVPIDVGFHHAVLSRSGLTMILQGPLKPGEARQGLFVCKRVKLTEPWSEPKPLTSINSSDGVVGTCSPSLSGDSRFLYFASDRPGGKGGLDLFGVAVSEVEELKK